MISGSFAWMYFYSLLICSADIEGSEGKKKATLATENDRLTLYAITNYCHEIYQGSGKLLISAEI